MKIIKKFVGKLNCIFPEANNKFRRSICIGVGLSLVPLTVSSFYFAPNILDYIKIKNENPHAWNIREYKPYYLHHFENKATQSQQKYANNDKLLIEKIIATNNWV